MSKYKVVLFDLDGTLTDSKPGITKSVQYALGKMGIIEDDLDRLEYFVGPPLLESFKKGYGFDEEKARLAVSLYREYFTEKGMFDNSVYGGIESMLKKLRDNGKRLAVATSKPTVYAVSILEHFDLYRYFDMVIGSNLDGTRTKKAEVISVTLLEYKAFDKKNIVMVGDRIHDTEGAKANGIDSIAVSYGYGSNEEFESCGPVYKVKDVIELEKLLLY